MIQRAVASLLQALVMVYRYGISPVLPGHCRYHPTCSAYALDAIRLHGPWRGSLMAVARVLRCAPWGGWGYDPVPPSTGCSHMAGPESRRLGAHRQTWTM